jgi:hypothetical protein
MLGIEISERTVSRILRRLPRPPGQTWKTFLRNHLGQMVSNFFTVPTITLKVLFVFIVLEHRRREVPHFKVTDHPTAAWTSQQIVEAFAEHDISRYLRRDRDGVYGSDVRCAYGFAANRGNPHGAPQPLAESIRRAAHRLDPQRVSGPLHHP